jgi:multisubunit Na+/H+ antiporter MnhC subunit
MVITLMMIGLYTVISRGHLVKKLVGLNIFQAAVFLLYISMGFVRDGAAPILAGRRAVYSNPLPHVLILTAIVVGVATTGARSGAGAAHPRGLRQRRRRRAAPAWTTNSEHGAPA